MVVVESLGLDVSSVSLTLVPELQGGPREQPVFNSHWNFKVESSTRKEVVQDR